MTNSIREFMEKDHDRLDGIFQGFRRKRTQAPGEAKEKFLQFKSGLERHILWEEEILFPVFEDRTGLRGSGPTAVMRSEHRQIQEYLRRIQERLSGEGSKFAELESGLLGLLTDHNQKEEGVLYPWFDVTLDLEEAKKILKRMR